MTRRSEAMILMISSEPAGSCILSVFSCGKAGKPDLNSYSDLEKAIIRICQKPTWYSGLPQQSRTRAGAPTCSKKNFNLPPYSPTFPRDRNYDIELHFNKEILDWVVPGCGGLNQRTLSLHLMLRSKLFPTMASIK